MFPWQRYVVNVAGEVDPFGFPVYDEVFVGAPRRSGKTFLEQSVTAHRCSSPSLVVMTAQTRDAAKDRWLEIADHPRKRGLMQTPLAPWLKCTKGTGNELLKWTGGPGRGSEFRPFAPNENANHGGDPDLVFIDELWALSLLDKVALQQGYRPAWSVKPGQEWLLSAAGTARSSWLHDVRKRGRAAVEAGGQRQIAYFEWSIPERVHGQPVAEVGDEELLQLVIAGHPRRGHGLREEFLRGELASDRAGFLRAYGNVDQDDDGVMLVPGSRVEELSGVRIPVGERVSVGVSVDDERREATVVVGWPAPDGRVVLDVVRSAPGVRWVGPYVVDMPQVAQVAVKASGLGRDLGDELERAGVGVLRVGSADMVAASGRWLSDMVETGRIGLDRVAGLESSLRAARLPARRSVESRSGEPVTVVEGQVLALWAADHMPAEEAPPARFRIL